MASPNGSTDEAVEEVNDAVEDGGGCTEAWEALSDLRDQSNTNRRKFLRAMGAGAAATGGIGSLSGSALAAENEDEPPLQKVNGSKKNKLRAKAVQTDEFKTLRQHIIKNLDAKLRVNNVSVFDVKIEDKSAYAVKVPIDGIENSPDASVAILVHDGNIEDVLSVISIADGDKITEVRKYRADNGDVETTIVPTATSDERKKMLAESDISAQATASGNCGNCPFFVRRLCDYGCIVGGAAFCAIIGLASVFIGGVACSVLFGIYCYEYGFPCYQFGSPRADCDRLLNVC